MKKVIKVIIDICVYAIIMYMGYSVGKLFDASTLCMMCSVIAITLAKYFDYKFKKEKTE